MGDEFECTQVLSRSFKEDSSFLSSKIEVGRLNVNGVQYPIYSGSNTIGRDPRRSSVVLDNKSISGKHAVIEVDSEESHLLADLGSSNKTYLGKTLLRPNVRYNLQDGAQIQFADLQAVYHVTLSKEEDDSILAAETQDLNFSKVPKRVSFCIPASQDVLSDSSLCLHYDTDPSLNESLEPSINLSRGEGSSMIGNCKQNQDSSIQNKSDLTLDNTISENYIQDVEAVNEKTLDNSSKDIFSAEYEADCSLKQVEELNPPENCRKYENSEDLYAAETQYESVDGCGSVIESLNSAGPVREDHDEIYGAKTLLTSPRKKIMDRDKGEDNASSTLKETHVVIKEASKDDQDVYDAKTQIQVEEESDEDIYGACTEAIPGMSSKQSKKLTDIYDAKTQTTHESVSSDSDSEMKDNQRRLNATITESDATKEQEPTCEVKTVLGHSPRAHSNGTSDVTDTVKPGNSEDIYNEKTQISKWGKTFDSDTDDDIPEFSRDGSPDSEEIYNEKTQIVKYGKTIGSDSDDDVMAGFSRDGSPISDNIYNEKTEIVFNKTCGSPNQSSVADNDAVNSSRKSPVSGDVYNARTQIVESYKTTVDADAVDEAIPRQPHKGISVAEDIYDAKTQVVKFAETNEDSDTDDEAIPDVQKKKGEVSEDIYDAKTQVIKPGGTNIDSDTDDEVLPGISKENALVPEDIYNTKTQLVTFADSNADSDTDDEAISDAPKKNDRMEEDIYDAKTQLVKHVEASLDSDTDNEALPATSTGKTSVSEDIYDAKTQMIKVAETNEDSDTDNEANLDSPKKEDKGPEDIYDVKTQIVKVGDASIDSDTDDEALPGISKEKATVPEDIYSAKTQVVKFADSYVDSDTDDEAIPKVLEKGVKVPEDIYNAKTQVVQHGEDIIDSDTDDEALPGIANEKASVPEDIYNAKTQLVKFADTNEDSDTDDEKIPHMQKKKGEITGDIYDAKTQVVEPGGTNIDSDTDDEALPAVSTAKAPVSEDIYNAKTQVVKFADSNVDSDTDDEAISDAPKTEVKISEDIDDAKTQVVKHGEDIIDSDTDDEAVPVISVEKTSVVEDIYNSKTQVVTFADSNMDSDMDDEAIQDAPKKMKQVVGDIYDAKTQIVKPDEIGIDSDTDDEGLTILPAKSTVQHEGKTMQQSTVIGSASTGGDVKAKPQVMFLDKNIGDTTVQETLEVGGISDEVSQSLLIDEISNSSGASLNNQRMQGVTSPVNIEDGSNDSETLMKDNPNSPIQIDDSSNEKSEGRASSVTPDLPELQMRAHASSVQGVSSVLPSKTTPDPPDSGDDRCSSTTPDFVEMSGSLSSKHSDHQNAGENNVQNFADDRAGREGNAPDSELHDRKALGILNSADVSRDSETSHDIFCAPIQILPPSGAAVDEVDSSAESDAIFCAPTQRVCQSPEGSKVVSVSSDNVDMFDAPTQILRASNTSISGEAADITENDSFSCAPTQPLPPSPRTTSDDIEESDDEYHCAPTQLLCTPTKAAPTNETNDKSESDSDFSCEPTQLLSPFRTANHLDSSDLHDAPTQKLPVLLSSSTPKPDTPKQNVLRSEKTSNSTTGINKIDKETPGTSVSGKGRRATLKPVPGTSGNPIKNGDVAQEHTNDDMFDAVTQKMDSPAKKEPGEPSSRTPEPALSVIETDAMKESLPGVAVSSNDNALDVSPVVARNVGRRNLSLSRGRKLNVTSTSAERVSVLVLPKKSETVSEVPCDKFTGTTHDKVDTDTVPSKVMTPSSSGMDTDTPDKSTRVSDSPVIVQTAESKSSSETTAIKVDITESLEEVLEKKKRGTRNSKNVKCKETTEVSIPEITSATNKDSSEGIAAEGADNRKPVEKARGGKTSRKGKTVQIDENEIEEKNIMEVNTEGRKSTRKSIVFRSDTEHDTKEKGQGLPNVSSKQSAGRLSLVSSIESKKMMLTEKAESDGKKSQAKPERPGPLSRKGRSIKIVKNEESDKNVDAGMPSSSREIQEGYESKHSTENEASTIGGSVKPRKGLRLRGTERVEQEDSATSSVIQGNTVGTIGENLQGSPSEPDPCLQKVESAQPVQKNSEGKTGRKKKSLPQEDNSEVADEVPNSDPSESEGKRPSRVRKQTWKVKENAEGLKTVLRRSYTPDGELGEQSSQHSQRSRRGNSQTENITEDAGPSPAKRHKPEIRESQSTEIDERLSQPSGVDRTTRSRRGKSQGESSKQVIPLSPAKHHPSALTESQSNTEHNSQQSQTGKASRTRRGDSQTVIKKEEAGPSPSKRHHPDEDEPHVSSTQEPKSQQAGKRTTQPRQSRSCKNEEKEKVNSDKQEENKVSVGRRTRSRVSESSSASIARDVSLSQGSATAMASPMKAPTVPASRRTRNKEAPATSQEIVAAESDGSSPKSTAVKRGRGRPRKDSTSEIKVVEDVLATSPPGRTRKRQTSAVSEAEVESPLPKKAKAAGGRRGRNAKSDVSLIAEESFEADSLNTSTSSLKRLNSAMESFSSDVDSGTRRGRGRSRMNESFASTASTSSPRSSRRTGDASHRVMFTGYNNPEHEKIVTQLGGTLVVSVDAANILVTDKLRRTVKLLSIVGRGQPVVSPDWLVQSKKSGRFLDPWDHLLSEPESELKFGFKLRDTLQKAAGNPLLSGYHVFITKNVKPPMDEMKSIVTSCGGKVLPRTPATWPLQSVVISCVEDKSTWSKLKSGCVVVSNEWLLSGVLQQQLNTKLHQLK